MPKRQSAKISKGERNDSRKNGKAFKNGNPHTRGVSLSETQKILLGGGLLVNIRGKAK